MRYKLAAILFLINSLTANLITQDEAQKIIKNFLDFHVDQKVISEPLYQKLKKNFIHLFDPDKSYLLEGELSTFTELESDIIKKNIETLEKGKFDGWQKEFYAFKHTIQRARSLRHEVYRQLLLELQFERSSLSQNQLIYARDLQELKDRWFKKIARYLQQELKFVGLKTATLQQKKIVFELFEKKMAHMEEKFLSKDRASVFYEHFLKSFAKSFWVWSS